MSVIDLRCGRYQDVLADVECDAVITDPPYSDRTHGGQRTDDTKDGSTRRSISYSHWTEEEISEFADFWADRCRGWICVMTSHDLAPIYEKHLERTGRYVFAPVPCVIPGMTCRLGGDGPSSWTVWLIVARPKMLPYSKWGTLPGAYQVSPERNSHIGGKPAALMKMIVHNYSRPGDLIVDPCAGWGTTLLAASSLNRSAIGSELDPDAYREAMERISAGHTGDMFSVLEDAQS